MKKKEPKEVESEDEVHKLMTSSKPVAIFFYSAMCPHCQVMHKAWDKLYDMHPETEFYKVESENTPDDLGINGVPHYKIIKDGKEVKSDGGAKDGTDDEKAKELDKTLFTSGGRRRRNKSRRRRAFRLVGTRRKVSH